MDYEGLTSDHTWKWLTGQVSTCPPNLVYSYRHLHHQNWVFTRYRTGYWDSSALLDFILASLDMDTALPIKEASVLKDQTFFQHQPGTVPLQLPSAIFFPTPPPPPMVFRALKSHAMERLTEQFSFLAD